MSYTTKSNNVLQPPFVFMILGYYFYDASDAEWNYIYARFDYGIDLTLTRIEFMTNSEKNRKGFESRSVLDYEGSDCL